MKKATLLLLLPALSLLAGGACERHDWESTSRLHHHGSHGGDHGDHGGKEGGDHHGGDGADAGKRAGEGAGSADH